MNQATTTATMSSELSFHDVDADIVLSIIQFMNVIDSSHFATTCRRHNYLVHQFRSLSTTANEFVAATSHDDVIVTSLSTTADENNAEKYKKQRTNRLTKPLREQPEYLVCKKAIQKLRTKPMFGLGFCKNSSDLPKSIPRFVPDDTVLLCSCSQDIQSSGIVPMIDNVLSTDGTNVAKQTITSTVTECDSESGLILSSIQNAKHIIPFIIPRGELPRDEDCQHEIEQIVPISIRDCESQNFSFFIVYAVQNYEYSVEIEPFITVLQQKYPKATIVGGICDDAYISIPISDNTYLTTKCGRIVDLTTDKFLSRTSLIELYKCLGGHPRVYDMNSRSDMKTVENACKDLLEKKTHVLQQLRDGICGIGFATGTDSSTSHDQTIPVHAIVSRGVSSRITARTVAEQSVTSHVATKKNGNTSSPFYVLESDYHVDFILEPYHFIRKVVDKESSRVYTVRQFFDRYGVSDYVGIQYNANDPYDLQSLDPYSPSIPVHTNQYFNCNNNSSPNNIGTNPPSLVGCRIDLFDLDANQCKQHAKDSMIQLQNQLLDKEILGCIMYNCNGRGPKDSQLILDEMQDATCFASIFPAVPCLGYYASGEIGPNSTVNVDNDVGDIAASKVSSPYSIGNAKLQGFTAVWAVFVVPTPDKNLLRSLKIDDSIENVQHFLRNRMKCYNDK